MIQDRDYDSNVDTDDILLLLAEWDVEREFYDIKTQSHDPDTPTYMEVLSDREDCQCEAFQRSTG